MNDKPLEQWTFDELVEYHTGHVLLGIVRGNFKGSMSLFAQHVLQWAKARAKKDEEQK